MHNSLVFLTIVTNYCKTYIRYKKCMGFILFLAIGIWKSNRLGVVAGENKGHEMLSMRCRAARRRVGGMDEMDMGMTRADRE